MKLKCSQCYWWEASDKLVYKTMEMTATGDGWREYTCVREIYEGPHWPVAEEYDWTYHGCDKKIRVYLVDEDDADSEHYDPYKYRPENCPICFENPCDDENACLELLNKMTGGD